MHLSAPDHASLLCKPLCKNQEQAQKRTQKQNHSEDLFPTASILTITNFTSNYASIDSSHPEIKNKKITP